MQKYALAPIAVLSTACAMRPWTPSVSVAYWSEDTPGLGPTNLPLASDAISHWQLPPGDPWSRYSKMTLLTALDGAKPYDNLPDITAMSAVHRAEAAASALAQAGVPTDTLFLLDLRGAASVAFAAQLSRASAQPISPVLTFNNWPSDDELVPAEETLAALIRLSPRLPNGRNAGVPVFMLDAWRLAYRFDSPSDDTVDNRYILNPSDLPDADALRANGINRVVYVVEDLDDTETEEDDVHDVMLGYQQAGLPLYMVDLAWLVKRDRPPVWREELTPQLLVVESRTTVISDPLFYARARGGFGGGGG